MARRVLISLIVLIAISNTVRSNGSSTKLNVVATDLTITEQQCCEEGRTVPIGPECTRKFYTKYDGDRYSDTKAICANSFIECCYKNKINEFCERGKYAAKSGHDCHTIKPITDQLGGMMVKCCESCKRGLSESVGHCPSNIGKVRPEDIAQDTCCRNRSKPIEKFDINNIDNFISSIITNKGHCSRCDFKCVAKPIVLLSNDIKSSTTHQCICDVHYKLEEDGFSCRHKNCAESPTFCPTFEKCVDDHESGRPKCIFEAKVEKTKPISEPVKMWTSKKEVHDDGVGRDETIQENEGVDLVDVHLTNIPQDCSEYLSCKNSTEPDPLSLPRKVSWPGSHDGELDAVDSMHEIVDNAIGQPQHEPEYELAEVTRCESGYEFDSVSHCRQINECEQSPEVCDATTSICVDTDGSYECRCNHGFHHGDNHQTCEDIDECEEIYEDHKCPAPELCVNLFGSFECICPANMTRIGLNDACVPRETVHETICNGFETIDDTTGIIHCFSCPIGFVAMNNSGLVCEDVDECQFKEACENGTFCVNTIGGHKCVDTTICKEFYKLDFDANSMTCFDKEFINRCKDGDCSKDPRPKSVSFKWVTFLSNRTRHASTESPVVIYSIEGMNPKYHTVYEFDKTIVSSNSSSESGLTIEDLIMNNFDSEARKRSQSAPLLLTKNLIGPQDVELQIDVIAKVTRGKKSVEIIVHTTFLHIFVSEYDGEKLNLL